MRYLYETTRDETMYLPSSPIVSNVTDEQLTKIKVGDYIEAEFRLYKHERRGGISVAWRSEVPEILRGEVTTSNTGSLSLTGSGQCVRESGGRRGGNLVRILTHTRNGVSV